MESGLAAAGQASGGGEKGRVLPLFLSLPFPFPPPITPRHVPSPPPSLPLCSLHLGKQERPEGSLCCCKEAGGCPPWEHYTLHHPGFPREPRLDINCMHLSCLEHGREGARGPGRGPAKPSPGFFVQGVGVRTQAFVAQGLPNTCLQHIDLPVAAEPERLGVGGV